MASTQELTKLPTIQYTGMDYSTVISEIKSIIDNNKNWKSNWTQFYSSEAGTMLVQLMAWICDNLAIRQDLLYNEGFLSTAQSDSSKYRLLQQIGYFMKGTNGATVNISVGLEQPTAERIYLSNHRESSDGINTIKNKILKFRAPDVNGKDVAWEILRKDSDGNILYTESVELLGNSTYYETGVDNNGESYQLTALQGETKYLNCNSEEQGGVVFSLGVDNCDTDSIAVYDIETQKKHIKVNSFQELCSSTYYDAEKNGTTPCYILERNDNGILQIRYPSETLINNSSIAANHSYKPGKKVGIFFRTSSGTDGNILPDYFSVDTTVKTESGSKINITIKNELSAYGGENAEELSDAVKEAPIELRTNSRAVTIEDFDKVLQQNDFILNSKSYSPYNEPDGFKDYYGRKMYPHETFGFISTNKNFTEIPIDSLNYYPWVDTVKDHVLNEHYNFFNCEVNQSFDASGSFTGSYLSKTLNKGILDSDYIYSNTNEKYYRIHNNISIYKTGRKLNSTINSELNQIETNQISEDDTFMEVKVHTDNFDGLYIKNISNNLFVLGSDSSHTFKTGDNVVEDTDNYNASFTSNVIYNNIIDAVNCPDLNVIFDNNISLTINLHKEKNSELEYSAYYLKLDNDENFEESTADLTDTEEDSFINSQTAANYRRGVLQLCQDAYDDYIYQKEEHAIEIARDKNQVRYLDLGLQIPKCYTFSYGESADKLFNFPADGFYRIKINDTIYGFKINETVLNNAYEYYAYNANLLNSSINVFDPISNYKNVLSTIDYNGNNNLNLSAKYEKIEQEVTAEKWQTYYDSKYQEQIKEYNLPISEASAAATKYANEQIQNDITIAKTAFSDTVKKFTKGDCYDVLDDSSVNFTNCINEDGTIGLTVDKISALLAYLFSKYNGNETTYIYENGSWKATHDVLDGKLRISCVSRNHTSSSTQNPGDKFTADDYIKKQFDDNKVSYFDNTEWDIRFDYIGTEDFSVSSVNSTEIKGINTIDFIQQIFGYNKKIGAYNLAADEYTADDLFYINNLNGTDKFAISSPRSGIGGTLELSGSGKLNSSIVYNCFGCTYVNTATCNLDYSEDLQNIWFTERVNGMRALEMIVDKKSVYLSTDQNLKTDISLENGDFIFVDNDINMVNRPTQILISYKLSPSTVDGKLTINKRDNFYYTDGNGNKMSYADYCKSKGIEQLVAIEGGAVYTDEDGNTQINTDLSDWSIKLTKDPYEDTNNYYSINENSLETLNVTKCNNVQITTNIISTPDYPKDSELEKYPFIFRIDGESGDTELNSINDIIAEVDTNFLNAATLLDKIYNNINFKKIYYNSDTAEANICTLKNTICRYEKNDSSRLVFTNITKVNGNIIFRYPVKYADVTNEHVQAFYKMLLGTSVNNQEFYLLYPKDCMDENNVFYVKDENGKDTEEFFYAPNYDKSSDIIYDLELKYRTFENENTYEGLTSRFADYYIEVSKNDSPDFAEKTYTYKICKTDTSEFPDTGFYLHYVQDRTIGNESNLEEYTIQKYLDKYMIAGTDFSILKPCFKSFDIEGKVYYNANYTEKAVKDAITDALNGKYQLKNISNISINNKIFLSDVMKIIMNIEGVEHVQIDYFGLNAKDKTTYPTQNYYLKLDDNIGFYTMLVLAKSANGRGINLLYEKNEE